MNTVTKQFTITATPDTMRKFERFLCFFHYNGGHSGLFAMPFDGDGHEVLSVDPPPERINSDHHLIADAGHELEIAYEKSYGCFALDRNRTHYKAQDGTLTRVQPDGTEEICKEAKK